MGVVGLLYFIVGVLAVISLGTRLIVIDIGAEHRIVEMHGVRPSPIFFGMVEETFLVIVVGGVGAFVDLKSVEIEVLYKPQSSVGGRPALPIRVPSSCSFHQSLNLRSPDCTELQISGREYF